MAAMKTLGIVIASLLLFAGCKKKEEPAAGTASGSSAMGSGSSAMGSDTGGAMGSAAGSGSDMAAGSGSAAAGSGSAATGSDTGGGGGAAAGGAIKDDADYMAKGEAMVDEMTGIMVGAGTDCKKLATDITAFVAKNEGMVKEAKAYEKEHPAAKKAFDAKMKPKQKDMIAKVGPTMKACAKDKDVQAAMKKMEMK